MRVAAVHLWGICVLQLAVDAESKWGGSWSHWNQHNPWIPDGVKDWMRHLEQRDASGMPKWQRHLCKKMGRFADKVPAFGQNDCSHDDSEPQSDFKTATASDLKSMLWTEQDKSKRLREDLRKEKSDKEKSMQAMEEQQKHSRQLQSNMEAKDREFMTEKADRKQKERLLWALEEKLQQEETQHKYLNSKLEATIIDLDNERIGKSQGQQTIRQMKDQAKHQRSQLEAKVRGLEKYIAVASTQHAIKHAKLLKANQSKSGRISDLEKELEKQKVSREETQKHELSVQLEAERSAKLQLMYTLNDERLLCSKKRTPLPIWLAISCLVAAIGFLVNQAHAKSSQLHRYRLQYSSLQTEFNSELAGMMKIDDLPQNLGQDFSFHIFDSKLDEVTLRSIKIQCPGVRHSDVSIDIIRNGCIVKINRPSSQGVDAVQWTQQFQFRPSEGSFEFMEDQAALDHGFLTLVFRGYGFQSRPFRFPQHFDLSEAASDVTWEYSHESPALCATEPSIHGDATGTSELIEMAAAVAAEFEDDVTASETAKTLAMPIDPDDHVAPRNAVGCGLLDGSLSTGGCIENPVPATMLAGLPTDQSSELAAQEAVTEVEHTGFPEVASGKDSPLPLLLSMQNSPVAMSSGGTSEGFEKVSEHGMSAAEQEEDEEEDEAEVEKSY